MLEQTRLPPGSMLGDRYRIDRLLSTGAMGAVYAANHTLLHKPVAIKVLRTDIPGADQMVDRFRREAIAASAIGHENIVAVTDMGLGPSGTPYLVMELLEGCDLATAIEAEAPMPVARACDIAVQMLRGLGAAHEAGIVHRDLKPENLFLSRTARGEVVKILDFGVSLLEHPDLPDGRLTSTGVAVGTPRYMSPEQASGEHHLTSAVDIYAAGVVLYEMLTGTLPYPGANYNVVIHQIIAGDWVPLEVRRSELPHQLGEAVDRALALEPGDRFASVEAMTAALAPFAGGAAKPAGAEAASSWVRPSMLAAHSDRSSEAFAATVNLKPGKAGATRRPLLQHDTSADPAWTEKKAAGPVSLEGSRVFDADPERELEARRRRRGRRVTSLLLVLALAAAAAVAVVMWRRSRGVAPAATLDRSAAGQATDPGAEAAQAKATPPEPATPPEVPEPEPAPADPVASPAANADDALAKKDEATAEPAPEPKAAAKPDSETERSKSKSRSGSDGEKKHHHHAKSREVRLSFLVLPRSAAVTVHGVPVHGSSMEIARGSKAVAVAVHADGYISRTLRVVPNRDREIVVSLQPEPKPEPKPTEADQAAKADQPEPKADDSASKDPEPAPAEGGAETPAPAPPEPPAGDQ